MTHTLTRDWKLHPEPVFQVKSRCVEDFTAQGGRGCYWGIYVRGETLQDQRIYRTEQTSSPLGPFTEKYRISERDHERHTRMARGFFGGDYDDCPRALVAAVWPGLPNSGLWLYELSSAGEFMEARIVVPPEPPYSVEASNPTCMLNDDGTVDFVFEGRGKQVDWRLYQGRIHADGRVTVDKTEICPGANPSLFRDGNRVYLYHSRRAHGLPGFDTWAFYQDL